jgi:hypothetical protein
MGWSNCPSQQQMFDDAALSGQGDSLAISGQTTDSTEIIPNEQARVLASYLLSLKRDDIMPDALKHPVEGEEKVEESK